MSADVNSSFIQRAIRKFFKLVHSVFANFEWPSVLILAILPSEAFESHETLRLVMIFLGAVLFLMGLVLRLWARGYEKAGQFVLDGPYRYVQNPDELGALLLYVGVYLSLGVMWSWVIAFAFLLLFYFACVSGAYEEKLKKKVGAAFPRYRSRVNRWWPAFYPAVNRSKVDFSWKKALKQEYSVWVWLLAILIVVALRKSQVQ